MNYLIFLLLTCVSLHGGDVIDAPKTPTKEEPSSLYTEEAFLDKQTVTIEGKTISYNVSAGSLTVPGSDPATKANVHFIAYCKKMEKGETKRPLAFCFNGGPGSASIWLHMGFLGPKIVDMEDLVFHPQPCGYKNNPHSLLIATDLVFIDAVSTGFSEAITGCDPKKFHGVEEDITVFSEFIRLYLTKFQRWNSPLFLIGESYGTFRAAGLADMLSEKFSINLNGVILISSTLDIGCDFSSNTDISCFTNLPTFSLSAQYHSCLEEPLASMSPLELAKEVKEFALHDYAQALILGSSLPQDKKEEIAKKLSYYTSIPKERFLSLNLRLPDYLFFSELLKNKNLLLGRFDTRVAGYAVPGNSLFYYDPADCLISGQFSSAFNSYMLQELSLKKETTYRIVYNVFPWNFGSTDGLRYSFDVYDSLRKAITQNPSLKVFVAMGLYDLATPWLSQQYEISHLLLPEALQKNISSKEYEAGHMMYLNPKCRKELFYDLLSFVNGCTNECTNTH